ncbi:MAG TPA: GlsB/YeaQ/YmgE family stress response membrane protein [Paracoccaceae bacterium]|nr:GlsB/YeaQ/YmgE family stress response membrane protein [Paracoccaceae bacterium]
MEEFFQALGVIGLIILLVIGVAAGLIASTLQGGRNRARNIVIGAVGALLLPFIVTLLFAGVLAASGLLLILFLAAIGAVIVLAIARMIAR